MTYVNLAPKRRKEPVLSVSCVGISCKELSFPLDAPSRASKVRTDPKICFQFAGRFGKVDFV